MTLTFERHGARYRVRTDVAIDLALPLHFDGPQPSLYGVPPASARAYEDGGFVGDTRRGGGCNFATVTLTPHCNGTHTEGVGHIADARIAVRDVAPLALLPATLATVSPVPAEGCGEAYHPPFEATDRVVTRRALAAALSYALPGFLDALILRTRGDEDALLTHDYLAEPAPFFTLDAMEYVVERGVAHLVVDLPSVDRAFDEGRLSAHHVFWGVPQGSHTVDPVNSSRKTITELVRIPTGTPDGPYLLSLQVPAFVSDAAPSRPLLYPVRRL